MIPSLRLALKSLSLCVAAATSVAVGPSVAATPIYAFQTTPKLLMVQPAGNGYNIVFRLNRPLPRRADGSYDAGTRTTAGFDSQFTTADKRNNCYFGAVRGKSKRVGTRVSVRLLLGDGRDPAGMVQAVQTLTQTLTAKKGTAGRHGSFKSEAAAAKALGCSHIDSRLG